MTVCGNREKVRRHRQRLPQRPAAVDAGSHPFQASLRSAGFASLDRDEIAEGVRRIAEARRY
jgi:hypothetical protein